MKWRKYVIATHRDLGYLCFGLTVIYAISGVAVNHIHSWNPTYSIVRVQSTIGPVLQSGPINEAFVHTVLQKLGEKAALKNIFQPDPETLKIFVEGNTITVQLKSGQVLQEKVQKRPLLYQLNFLHLNHPKKIWTWFADLYAIALMLLAMTGIIILKGKNGLKGRGKWLVAAGIFIPLFFLFLYS